MASNVPCDSPSVCLPSAAVCLPLLAKCLPPMSLGGRCPDSTSWHPFTFSGAAAGQKYLCAFRFLGEVVLGQLSSSPRPWVPEMAPDPLHPRRGQQGPGTSHAPPLSRRWGCPRLGRYQNRGINRCFSLSSYVNTNFTCSSSRKVNVTCS